MALFNFRDSWNVWRRKVDEALGTVEPISARNVILDSGTNVEDTIDSLNSNTENIESNVDSILNALGAKNLLPANAKSETINGITYTVNNDGSIKAEGTATGTSYLKIFGGYGYDHVALPNWLQKGKEYIVSDGTTDGHPTVLISFYDTDGTGISAYNRSNFTVPENAVYVGVFVWVTNGTTVDGTVYPMIRPAKVTDDTYVPYAMINSELTNKVSNCKIVSFNNAVSVTGTGVETYKELLDSVVSSLSNVVSSLKDNQFALIQRITLAGVTTLIPKAFYYGNTSDLHILAAINLGVTDTQLVYWAYSYPAGGSTFTKATYNLSTNVATFEDTGALVPSTGRTITIMYDIYERTV